MKHKFLIALVLTTMFSLTLFSLVYADNVINNIDTTIDDVLEVRSITVGNNTIVGFFVKPDNSDPNDINGCNATGSAPATATIDIPDNVAASPTTITFTDCTTVHNITFSSNIGGDYTIGIKSVSGGKAGSNWNLLPSKFTLHVEAPADVTPPSITPHITGTLGNENWYVSDVTVSWDVTDAESTITSSSGCETSSVTSDTTGTTFTCSATSAGGTSSESITIKRDATPPVITWDSDISDEDNFYFWFVPDEPTCLATDATSGVDINGCSVIGYSTLVGNHTLTATAYDVAGNKVEDTISYTVLAWTLHGFYQPVDMNGVWNTVKGGSTVPLKFEVFAGDTELTSTSVVLGFSAKAVACPTTGYTADEIEVLATGGTSLRYDLTAGQFIYNWQTPKKVGSCYLVTMTTQDGSALSANFKLK